MAVILIINYELGKGRKDFGIMVTEFMKDCLGQYFWKLNIFDKVKIFTKLNDFSNFNNLEIFILTETLTDKKLYNLRQLNINGH